MALKTLAIINSTPPINSFYDYIILFIIDRAQKRHAEFKKQYLPDMLRSMQNYILQARSSTSELPRCWYYDAETPLQPLQATMLNAHSPSLLTSNLARHCMSVMQIWELTKLAYQILWCSHLRRVLPHSSSTDLLAGHPVWEKRYNFRRSLAAREPEEQ